MSKELTKTGEFPVANLKNIKQYIAENFEGLTPEFPVVKIPTGGSTVFDLDGEPVKEIEGVIIDHYTSRALWMQKYGSGEGDTPPVCSSLNGRTGINRDTNEESLCEECEYNEWGSIRKIDETDTSRRKACRTAHRVFLLREGELLPLMIPLPVTSIRPFQVYMTRLASKGKPFISVITRITLRKNKNRTGIEYSVAEFSRVRDLPQDTVEELIKFRKLIKPICRNKPVEFVEAEEEVEPF